MRKNFNETSPLRPNLAKMEVGDVITYPLSRVSVLRTSCANLGLELDRTFKTRSDKKKRIVTVTRTA